MGGRSRVVRYHPATDRAQVIHLRVRDEMSRTLQRRYGGAFEALAERAGADRR
jgi:hypothetical protein